METNVIWRNARAAVIELDDGGYFTCAESIYGCGNSSYC